jgi:L-lactate dehydrogenase
LDDAARHEIDQNVRRAAYTIIEGKGATYYGIGSALARIVETILDNQQAILTVCAPMIDVAGVADVTLSLPHLVGSQGIVDVLPLPLNDLEEAGLKNSAQIIRASIEQLAIF